MAVAIGLSILIPTIRRRWPLFKRLRVALMPQLDSRIEVLVERDDGPMNFLADPRREDAEECSLHIGAKRNRLLDRAAGDYIAFVDDDDLVSVDYVQLVLAAIRERPDVVGTFLTMWENGVFQNYTMMSIENVNHPLGFARMVGGIHTVFRRPNHINPIRREIVMDNKIRFPSMDYREDEAFSFDVCGHLKKEAWASRHRPIYAYDCVSHLKKDYFRKKDTPPGAIKNPLG
jgi:Glycosyl transferase family 2